MRPILHFVLLLAMLGTTLGGLAQELSLPELGDVASATLSPQAERRIGEEAMRQIKAKEPAYLDDQEVTEYINSLGKRLVAGSSGPSQEFEFFVIRDDSINAFAMPGGYIGVHTGLLLAAQTESELASVLAHEVSHVTQRHIARLVGKQDQLSYIGLAGMLVALLATRSSGDLAQAALIGSQGGLIQAQLGYTRDFEREADRTGFQVLQKAGFDTNGMVSFFERLQKATRTYENNAPAYLRSHPLTTERMADIQNRAQGAAYKQHVDSLDFHLMRAKLRAEQGTAREAMAYFQGQVDGRRYASEAAARFGLVSALMRNRDFKRAGDELQRVRSLAPQNPAVDLLAMRLKSAAGDDAGAVDIVKVSLSRNPNFRPLRLAYARLLQQMGRHQQALAELLELGRAYPKDAQVFLMQAQSYAATRQELLMYRAQAEAYYLQGALPAAIEQLQYAQKAGGGDFYQLSSVEARLRELREVLAAERPAGERPRR